MECCSGATGGGSLGFWQRTQYLLALSVIRWLCWESTITCGPLSHLPGSRHHPTCYLDNCYLYVWILLPWSDVDLLCSLTSGCCSHVGKVGMELGRAWWPCFLLSHFVLFLNLLLGTVLSPFMPSLPQATCLETTRPRRNRLCSYPQCSVSGVSFCWLVLPAWYIIQDQTSSVACVWGTIWIIPEGRWPDWK